MVCFYAWKASSHRCNNGGGLVIPNISGSWTVTVVVSIEGILHQLRLVAYPIHLQVFFMSGGCFGFQPSIVVMFFSGTQTCNWVGATQIFSLCSPLSVGKMNPFWRANFSKWVGSTTNYPKNPDPSYGNTRPSRSWHFLGAEKKTGGNLTPRPTSQGFLG